MKNFPLIIIAIILGVSIFKNIDFHSFKIVKPALTLVYFIAFSMAIYSLLRKNKKE